jgi:hypothetical protein
MANESAILNKLERAAKSLGLAPVRDAVSVTVADMIISLIDPSIQLPMGGVSPASSPFLGAGICAPNIIKIKGAAGKNTLAAILASASDAQMLAMCAHFANDIVIEAGDTTAELARIPGHSDIPFLGQ